MFKTLCLSVFALIGLSSAASPKLYTVKDLIKLYAKGEQAESVVFEWYKNSTLYNNDL